MTGLEQQKNILFNTQKKNGYSLGLQAVWKWSDGGFQPKSTCELADWPRQNRVTANTMLKTAIQPYEKGDKQGLKVTGMQKWVGWSILCEKCGSPWEQRPIRGPTWWNVKCVSGENLKKISSFMCF